MRNWPRRVAAKWAPATAVNVFAPIITRKAGTVTMGIIVDEVSEVLDIVGEDIEPSPSFGTTVDTRFILGMAKTKGAVKILLDIDKVLSGDELEAVTAVA